MNATSVIKATLDSTVTVEFSAQDRNNDPIIFDILNKPDSATNERNGDFFKFIWPVKSLDKVCLEEFLFICFACFGRERQRGREADAQADRHRWIDRQTDRQTDRQNNKGHMLQDFKVVIPKHSLKRHNCLPYKLHTTKISPHFEDGIRLLARVPLCNPSYFQRVTGFRKIDLKSPCKHQRRSASGKKTGNPSSSNV